MPKQTLRAMRRRTASVGLESCASQVLFLATICPVVICHLMDHPTLPVGPSGANKFLEATASSRPIKKVRTFRLVCLSFCLHAAMAVLLLASIIYFTHSLNQIKSKLGQQKPPLSKRSAGPPPVKGILQQHMPGMEAIQLVGAVPVVRIDRNGTIGPWLLENNDIKWAMLNHDGSGITILNGGLYFIYAQVFYLTTETSNSYEITRWRGGPTELRGHPRRDTLTVCANQATNKSPITGGAAEVSCYTGVVSELQPGDHLSLHQIEQDRVILFTMGFSHWGAIRMQTGPSEV